MDEVSTPFGIRSIEWSAEKGFLLNGEPLKMAGGCVHHDNGPLGAAAFDRAEERRVRVAEGSGVQRDPDLPQSAVARVPRRLRPAGDAGDGRGVRLLVAGQEPARLQRVFKDWWQRDIDAMVLRDRNHPSVVMWSIGNEIPERGEPLGAEEAKTTRRITCARSIARVRSLRR